MEKSKVRIMLTTTFFIIQILIIIGLIVHAKYYYIGEAVTTIIFFIILIVLEVKYNLHVSNYLRALLIVTIISHSFLGNYMDFYINSSFFDKVLHVFGTYSFTFFAYTLINQITGKSTISEIREFIFVVSLGIALGVILEIVEFSGDMLFSHPIPYQSSLVDTNLDLVCNTIGAIITAFQVVILNPNFKRSNYDNNNSGLIK